MVKKRDGLGRCVVVIDDEPDLLDLLREVLEDDGFDVLPVDRPDRLEQIKHDISPDLVLVDLMLPGMTGIDLARRLKANSMAETPMIAMSASPSMLRAAVQSSLFEDALSKPFELADLLECVGRHVE